MIEDHFLKARTLKAIALQEQGCFITDHRHELPLPVLQDLRYSHATDEQGRYYDYETNWGRFSLDSESRTILVLRNGTPPDDLLPQPRLALGTAIVHSGYVSIQGSTSFDLDFQTRDNLDWETLRLVNQTLRAEQIPIVVWQIEEAQEEKTGIIRITNESALVFASSAIWDMDEQQLVAAHMVTTSQELLKAIKATLANNSSKNYLTVKTPDSSAFLKGAKRGYITVANSLTGANAEGTVTALLHPFSGDPQGNSAEHFYLVIAPDEPLTQKFAEHLDLAIPWPIRIDWAEYLLESGQEAGLVQVLPGSGKDFAAGLRVEKNESRWHEIISNGLKEQRITIA